MTVEELLRRFLQHVLPRGFQKVRHYGFLHPQCKTSLSAARWLLAIHQQKLYVIGAELEPRSLYEKPCCQSCGGEMVCTMIELPGLTIFTKAFMQIRGSPEFIAHNNRVNV